MTAIDFEHGKADSISLNRPFLDGYTRVFGRLNMHLLSAYRAHKRLTKSLKLACAVHPEGDLRAERALGQALACVDA